MSRTPKDFWKKYHCEYTKPGTNKPCAADLKCENNMECDDFNVCTDNICSSGICSFPSVANSTACPSDNDYCTRDICMFGKCAHIPFAPCCGNGVKEMGEQCDDGNRKSKDGCDKDCRIEGCSISICNDANPCTIDSCLNNECAHTNITLPLNNDGCCPSGADANNDSDCAPICGNNIVEMGEQCEPPSAGNCSGTCQFIIPTDAGACCLPLGSVCTVLSEASCISQSGSFKGNSTICDGTDSDNDTIENICDNCPNTPNANQTDSNNNGIGDACDNGNVTICTLNSDCLAGQICDTISGLCVAS